MVRYFALTVRLHDRRYHGAGEWPPAPARVFQALLAGAAQGRRVSDEAARALTLLERLTPPVIAAPLARRGQRVSLFVPNNDLDAVGGDPARVGEVRVRKAVQPHLLESPEPFLYAWSLPRGGGDELLPLADALYQFGRGVDPAWATGELLDDEQLEGRLRSHRGTVHRATTGDQSLELAVPTTSSFASLIRRFDATLARLRPSLDERTTDFVQPPKAHFAMVRYDGTPTFHLFELRNESEPARSSPWATWRVAALVGYVRDMATAALSSAFPERKADVERVLIGRNVDGSNSGPVGERVRFIPLPSIGHPHADQSIRRLLVQVPPGPFAEGDVLWALSGRPFFDPQSGEIVGTTLAAANADEMVERYRATSRTWRSVTPLVLGSAPRRRIEPKLRCEQAKSATERVAEERAAQHAVAHALRHAGITASLVRAHVQREPFDARGIRAELFAEGTRFDKEALWHAEIELDREVRGPITLGDGRFLGLGVLAPKIERGVFALTVEGGLHLDVDTTLLARALRRAVIARVHAVLEARGENDVPPYFHGHARDGRPLNTLGSAHLAFSVDVPRSRLLIVPPHILDGWHRPLREAALHLETLERALRGFTDLRAGSAGVLSLRVSTLASIDPLFRSSRFFQSVTDYVVNRHAKRMSAAEAVVDDVRRECDRRGLPKPDNIRIASVHGEDGVGVIARVELAFGVALRGPLLLGKTRYLGGGLFEPVQREAPGTPVRLER
jgi:CRISPR-associated protein Csb2